MLATLTSSARATLVCGHRPRERRTRLRHRVEVLGTTAAHAVAGNDLFDLGDAPVRGLQPQRHQHRIPRAFAHRHQADDRTEHRVGDVQRVRRRDPRPTSRSHRRPPAPARCRSSWTFAASGAFSGSFATRAARYCSEIPVRHCRSQTPPPPCPCRAVVPAEQATHAAAATSQCVRMHVSPSDRLRVPGAADYIHPTLTGDEELRIVQ